MKADKQVRIYPHFEGAFKIFQRYLQDLVFPEKCLSCGKAGGKLCTRCIAEKSALFENNEHSALVAYKDEDVRHAIWAMKFHRDKKIARVFGNFLFDRLLDKLSEQSAFSGTLGRMERPLLLPIPISKKRRRKRGFNQCEEICKGVLEMDTNDLFSYEPEILVKERETLPQTEIKNKVRRMKNLMDAFTLTDTAKVYGKTVFLIDDVSTTGTTFKEAERVLKLAGAKNVECFSVAH